MNIFILICVLFFAILQWSDPGHSSSMDAAQFKKYINSGSQQQEAANQPSNAANAEFQ
jgi:hypothetical protein